MTVYQRSRFSRRLPPTLASSKWPLWEKTPPTAGPIPFKADALGHGGHFEEALGLQVIDASFTVSCPGHDAYGSVTTWLPSNSSASLACGVNPGEMPWLQEAYQLTCGPLRH